MALESIVGADAVAAVQARGELDFHMMGDTGGINNPVPQLNVAAALEGDLGATDPAAFAPSFLYLLGDCIYFNGQEVDYYDQFYDPYTHYTVPILAIPGNHDGDPIDASQSTLDGFLQNFCTTGPQTNLQSRDSGRTTMTQPNVYWTLEALVSLIGLYTNVPEHGRLDDGQIAWLNSELVAAPLDKALLVAVHHPPISADDHHGSSDYMFGLLDRAIDQASRAPDMVVAGHVHDYQRFTRTMTVGGTSLQVPYVVAGAGGYPNLHTMAADAAAAELPWAMPNFEDVTLDAWVDDRYGFVRVRIGASKIDVEFVSVSPQPGVAQGDIAPTVVDAFSVDLAAHTVGKSGD